jgi:hypothetical protein
MKCKNPAKNIRMPVRQAEVKVYLLKVKPSN